MKKVKMTEIAGIFVSIGKKNDFFDLNNWG